MPPTTHRPHPPTRRTGDARLALALSLAALAAPIPGCVTEHSTSPLYSSRSSPRTTPARSDSPTTPVQLPGGPVTRPVTPAATVTAGVRAALMDLGSIPYDGQTLPLVSPDGRFVATQTGAPPSWPTILAAPGAEVPHATQLAAYALPDPNTPTPSHSPGEGEGRRRGGGAELVSWASAHTGMIVGRSCDTLGFLVEAPQPDGSRWIGRVSWVSGDLQWIVQGDAVNAYAVLGPAGELAYCRRGVDSHSIELVVHSSAREPTEFVAIPPGGAYLWPLFSDEPGVVYAVSLVEGAAELHALKLPERGEPQMLTIVGRQPLFRNADAATLYQVTASLQVPLPSTLTSPAAAPENTQQSARFDKLLFFHPVQGRMVIYDRRVAATVPLFAGSIAATPILANTGDTDDPHSGYLITTTEGLEYVPISNRSEFDLRRGVPATTEGGVAVIRGAYLPRLTTDPVWRTLLLGPGNGGSTPRIHLYRLMLAGAEGAAGGERQ